jgi:NADPH:quinone reductase-like Zn-dependent oxidoreductase
VARGWVARAWGGPDGWELAEVAVPAPAHGEVTIRVVAAGVNPADAKHVAAPRPGVELPASIGYEVSGVLAAIGPDTEIASGAATIGDDVLAFRIRGGWSTEVTVPARDVFHKPATVPHEEAANLLLAGSTAAEMLAVTRVGTGDTVLLHGASGAVGVSVLQQAALVGARVIGTASSSGADRVRAFGGEPVAYGPGLADRARAAGGGRIDAALDAVGTDEAVDVSLELVADRTRIVTIVAAARAAESGFAAIAGALPASAAFRDAARAGLIDLAASGRLVVPMARTYPLAEAREAIAYVMEGHPGGKVALRA